MHSFPVAEIKLTAQDFRRSMNQDQLLPKGRAFEFPLGTDQRYFTSVTSVIVGTDENGHRLEASYTVQLMREKAP